MGTEDGLLDVLDLLSAFVADVFDIEVRFADSDPEEHRAAQSVGRRDSAGDGVAREVEGAAAVGAGVGIRHGSHCIIFVVSAQRSEKS
jgi:hypothetical protein